eukprot:TRINITY_DN13877_c0_g1_i3.p1 TRINITY_DN13877_c0_g1~~TRINITY_DN13877_c0_g1_i3.p1  ORF type:complete len:606 (+),score=201.50 TRINITY_DN13877_c0_g1_i3:245-2062(+)
MIQDEDMEPMAPWYRGFTGVIERKEKDPSSFFTHGVITVLNDTTVEITELPVKKWTQDYKEFLEASIEGEGKKNTFIKEFQEYHTDTKAHFVVTMSPEQLSAAQSEGLHKKFKLTSSISTSNMHLFDGEGHIRKYDTPEEILRDFYDLRIDMYHNRKAHMVNRMRKEWSKLDSRARFIRMVVDGELIISKKKKADLLVELAQLDFPQFGKEKAEETKEDETSEDEDEIAEIQPGGYDYLLGMPMWSLTLEKIESLTEEALVKKEELEALEAKSSEDLYMEDLEELQEATDLHEEAIQAAENKSDKIKTKANAKKGKGKAKAAAKKKLMQMMNDSDELEEMDFDDSEDDSDFESKKPKAKPKARAPAKPRQAVKAVVKPTAAAVKPAVKPAAKADDEPLSLMERLAQKTANVTMDEVKLPATKKTVARAKTTKSKMVVSEDDTHTASDDYTHSDFSDEEPVVAKKKPAPRAKKAVVKIASSDDDFSDEEPVVAKKKPAPRAKKAVVISDDTTDDDISDFVPPPKHTAKRGAPARSTAATAVKGQTPVKSPPLKKRLAASGRPGRVAASKAADKWKPEESEEEDSYSEAESDDCDDFSSDEFEDSDF